jgi:hypothetical protein
MIPPTPAYPLTYFPEPNREDDESVAEIVTKVGIDTGIIKESLEDFPLWVRYEHSRAKDVEDQEGLQEEIKDAQEFWANASALGLTEWCSKEDFVREFWFAKNYDKRSDQWTDQGFSKCPDEDTTQRLREMARQYPDSELIEDVDGDLYFYRGSRKHYEAFVKEQEQKHNNPTTRKET